MGFDRIAQSKAGDKTAPDIRVVFFDIGNVLLRFDPKRVLQRFAWALRTNPLRVARLAWTGRLSEKIERGEITARDIYRMLQDELGYQGSFARFRKGWCDQFSVEKGSTALLKKVAARRRVFLLSNTHAMHYEFIRRRYAFPRYIHGAVLSHRVGMRKPEPGIYLEALRRARVAPEASLFIDDLKRNVDAARALGMNVIRYHGASDLAKRLAEFGVL